MATIKLPNSDQFDTMNGHLANIVSTATNAIGNRTYTENNYVTDSETVTASIDALDLAMGDIFNLVYPVGSIYISVASVNPGTLFGGTWVAFGAGRVPVGLDATQTEFDTVEETGGAKTHALIEAELPEHYHTVPEDNDFANVGSSADRLAVNMTSTRVGLRQTSTVGSGTAHNNLAPYIVVRMWKRTA